MIAVGVVSGGEVAVGGSSLGERNWQPNITPANNIGRIM
jgi:hypothetical protein